MIHAFALLSSFIAVAAQRELLVKTTLGPVQGHYNTVGVREWNGIPFAKPPVGDLRWEYPQSPKILGIEYTMLATWLLVVCRNVIFLLETVLNMASLKIVFT